MSNKFDYVAYDDQAKTIQAAFKESFLALEAACGSSLHKSRYQALAITALEEAYCWIGKAIRDDQIKRNGSAELEEGRSDS